MKKFAICLPTLNPGNNWEKFLDSFNCQIDRPYCVLIVDSSSADATVEKALDNGFLVEVIKRENFDHGGVRNRAIEALNEAEVIIFLTQDVLLADPQALGHLLDCFDDASVGLAYGRQLPHLGSGPIEAHARVFNYSKRSLKKSLDDTRNWGLKTAFSSNSFAAYRRTALEAVGGFPERCIVSEDTYVAAKMILAGWKIAYCAEAQVYHSHNYNFRQEFQRYFDIGVFHAREPWVRERFGGAEGEGLRFLKSEMKYLAAKAPWLIPSALIRTPIRYLGFRAGLAEKLLPVAVKRRLSMQKAFWGKEL
ncbi:glycosyltransferase family 2 protein [Desulfuromonas versatilis]|uniref:glycosyltransferase family 2 protein n=1 Tax=Desulfuromonas versatilis TaxID=2802975 RepID=UPI001C8583C5|nr:glycosyltransferase [Desulfuromonas versatilis]